MFNNKKMIKSKQKAKQTVRVCLTCVSKVFPKSESVTPRKVYECKKVKKVIKNIKEHNKLR